MLTSMLSSIDKTHHEMVLILDKNFLTKKDDLAALKDDGFTVFIRKSRSVPGIQIADVVAGTMRLFHEGKTEFPNILLSRVCEYSKNHLNTPGVWLRHLTQR